MNHKGGDGGGGGTGGIELGGEGQVGKRAENVVLRFRDHHRNLGQIFADGVPFVGQKAN